MSAGLEALDAALGALYPGVEPAGWESLLRSDAGNADPLDEVRCYRCGDHWHYVTFGLTELYRKVSPLREQSGFGFELTFRLAGEGAAPDWPVAFLQGLAGYVVGSRRTFAPGDLMDLGGPLGAQDTALVAALFVSDPALPELSTPHGSVRFVQVVGITRDEFELGRDGGTSPEPALREQSPLLVTHLSRALPERPKGPRRQVSFVEWESPDDEQVLLTLDEEGRRLVLASLDEVARGATLELDGPDQSVRFVAGAADWSRSRATLIVRVPPGVGVGVGTLEPWMRDWTLPALPFLRIHLRE